MKETPSQLNIPSYVMNFPFTLSADKPNNIWMEELKPEELEINRPKAYKQFMDLYNFIAGQGLVYLLPRGVSNELHFTNTEKNLQDQVYVANLGLHLPHIKDRNVMLLSNYTSEPRQGEEFVGEEFYKMMGYETYICPFKFEGEADIKYLKDNVYIGGYGQRSQLEAYEWMEKEFGMKIIKLKMEEPYLYHLDCSIFPLTNNKTMVCTLLYTPEEIAELEQYTTIIDISEDDAFGGITNSVRLGNMILCSSNISELKKGEELYNLEKNKIETLERICGDEGMEAIIFNLSEYMKSGALLSCCVQHLNRVDINKKLI